VFYGLIFIFSLFLQRHEGLSPLATGLAFLPVTVLIMASDLAAGRTIGRFGTQRVGAVGVLLTGAGCWGMFVIMSVHIAALVVALVAALSVTGFGIGLIVTALTSALLGSVDKSRSGIASGTLTAFLVGSARSPARTRQDLLCDQLSAGAMSCWAPLRL